MGGLLILRAALVPTLLWADLTNAYIWIAVLATAAFGAVGFADDYLKIVRRSHHGLLAALQDGLADRRRRRRRRRAAGAGERDRPLQHASDLPVLQAARFRTSAGSTCCSRSFVLVGCDQRGQPDRRPRRAGDQRVRRRRRGVHRARLRLDHRVFAEYLQLVAAAPRSGGADDLLRRAGRRQPRVPLVQLAIPPTSSWATSDRSASAARSARSRSSSSRSSCSSSSAACSSSRRCRSIIQVGSFKLTGQRVFRMAPLHHHFELIGWSEPKVITRFVILAIIFALFSLTTLKLR